LFFFPDTVQSSIPTVLQTQSQPTVLLHNSQQQLIQNLHALSQTSQSLTYPTVTPTPSSSSQQVLNNNTIPNDAIKQPILPTPPPTSSSAAPTPPNNSSTTTETIENHISISPSPTPQSVPHTSEAIQPAVPSDSQPQVSQYIVSFRSRILIDYVYTIDIQ